MLGMKKNYKKSKLEQLTAFVYLIEEKSIIKVAKKMHISPASVTMYIKSFEGAMKKTLFDRTNPKVLKPYPICDEIYQKAKQVVDLVDDVFVKIQEKGENVIRIACHPLVFDVFLEDCIKEIKTRNTKLDFELQDKNFLDAINDLIEDKIDIAIYPVSDEILKQYPTLKHIDLWKYEACIFAHKEHPITSKPDKDITFQDAFGSRSVSFRNSFVLSNIQNIIINTYADCEYINICDVLDTIKGMTPMDAKFIESIKKQKPDLINHIAIKDISHLNNNIYFRIIYRDNINIYPILKTLTHYFPF
jgi:hypothetical protein